MWTDKHLKSDTNKKRGFTIVELMIVIIVIGILVSISVVSYMGVQERSRDSAREAAAQQVRAALDLYRLNHGRFPERPSACGSHCNLNQLEEVLVPDYMDSIPDVPGGPSTIGYTHRDPGGMTAGGYVMRLIQSTGNCRYLVNVSETNTAFGANTPRC